jgi:hypothetical protein
MKTTETRSQWVNERKSRRGGLQPKPAEQTEDNSGRSGGNKCAWW